jgi:hypothetical protein
MLVAGSSPSSSITGNRANGAVFCFSERSGRLDELMPHPVYASMSWVQILSSTAAGYASLRPLLAETLDFARGKWNGRK